MVFGPTTTRLVVRDRVEEVVVARVDARVAHGAERAEHGRAAVLELARERARARGLWETGRKRALHSFAPCGSWTFALVHVQCGRGHQQVAISAAACEAEYVI